MDLLQQVGLETLLSKIVQAHGGIFLVSRPRNLRAKAMELLQDRICGRSPAERR